MECRERRDCAESSPESCCPHAVLCQRTTPHRCEYGLRPGHDLAHYPWMIQPMLHGDCPSLEPHTQTWYVRGLPRVQRRRHDWAPLWPAVGPSHATPYPGTICRRQRPVPP
uniref:Uncharacterized protein n=1 Tax=Cacopsylla melanoneura TaxID=428564 RepID=A0A8D8U903_9HEMI